MIKERRKTWTVRITNIKAVIIIVIYVRIVLAKQSMIIIAQIIMVQIITNVIFIKDILNQNHPLNGWF